MNPNLRKLIGLQTKQSITPIREAKTITPNTFLAYGEKPTTPFKTLRDWYFTDPSVKAAVDDLVAQTVGPGFYLTSNPELPQTKAVVDAFNASANLDEWLQVTVTEVVYAGNSFTVKPESWKNPPDFVEQIIPLSSIERVRRRKEGGGLLEVATRIEGEEVKYAADDLIHFAWNTVDRSALGTGLLAPLANPRFDLDGNLIPSLLEMKSQAEYDLHKVLRKYPPRYVIGFDVGDEAFNMKIRPILEKLKAGEDIATNIAKVEFKELSVASRYDPSPLFDYLLNQTYIGLESPLMRLYTSPGFTEASARAAVEVHERMVLMLQRFVKRACEHQIVEPVLLEHGFDPVKANVRLNWGLPDAPTLSFQDLSRVFELNGMSLPEYRKNLRKFGVELFDESLDKPSVEGQVKV